MIQSLLERFLGRSKGWEYTYQVRGGWPFPADMLRYDDAVPATAADKDMIARLSQENAESAEDIRNGHVVTLKGPRRPTERRWESFLWEVM
ncbi:hypothetical protein [Mesorhizobium sp. M8A.F.Ca.ET.021.01.1.1]|uniref:hypothetical protein n=1 Tax=Mesorhizobium sp. M8A.F.Ca.ET.021.01.1.1 TaxID=2496757 RepID=UPI000FCC65C7|nr:hypothetical protein [Mesorhizobium sp. M8A.F.Ca.ET.021.01.1.1]RUW56832.1 hypothetical protein EOA36_02210 [Mesorhizobium sp. M8A.F.Ca.ET.021.01.1.1]